MACRRKVDWTALPNDLVRKTGDFFLASEDLDYYTDFRGVCTSWRKAAMEPTEFYLTKWFMVAHTLPQSGDFTFLNLTTGRYFKKDLSNIHRRYYIAGVTKGGLIMLGERTQPHKMSLLNPLTGATNNEFQANIPADLLSAVAVTKSPMMVFVARNSRIRWADQNSPMWENDYDFGDGEFDLGEQNNGCLYSMTAFGNELYVTHTGDNGAIFSTNTQLEHRASHVTMERAIPMPNFERVTDDVDRFYLVESGGDLLLVIGGQVAPGQPVVYRVDTQNRSFEPVSGIGSRALFVTFNRCISVNTSITQTVEPGSIYYVDLSYIRRYCSDHSAWSEEPTHEDGYGRHDLNYNAHPDKYGPHRLDQILAGFCRRGEFYELLMSDDEAEEDRSNKLGP